MENLLRSVTSPDVDVSSEIFSFIGKKEFMFVMSLTCTWFFDMTNLMRRTAEFKWKHFGGFPGGFPGPFSLECMGLALHRFPNLCIVEMIAGLTSPELNEISRFIFPSLPSLVKLCLDNNHLTTLPDSIGALTGLKKLDLNNNHFTTLPDSIGALTGLTTLSLGDNHLTTLPDSIGALTNLKELWLDNNQLTTLPDSIGTLVGLKTLMLCDNRITTLPDSIGALTGLTHLHLDHNQLTALPESIGALTGLTLLYLHSNQLTALPESIVALTNLGHLSLLDNPPLIPSAQSAAVQAWLQALEDSPACNLRCDDFTLRSTRGDSRACSRCAIG